ncbi:hypothetical protein [Micromonospora inositola]|uniref:Uncharacterized protein n=1 Tax=Micromonospora inositola TaxID=47865 RepID=A0A1C5GYR1_9ACTN|nr:hypothetical protein [Micromonospora inositola]SCG38942.1 hypothetical protein GA0070613_0588 [Micromonospora inositola]
MQITEVSELGLRSAVITLARSGSPMRIVLFPMVHFGLPSFYRQVARRLAECDLIVAEGYDGPSSTGLAYAIAFRLTQQHGASGLVHQDIDYRALGVPVVWPERLTGPGRRDRLSWWGWLDVILLVPVLTVMAAVGGRGQLLRRGYEASDDSDPRLFLRFLQKPLLNDRDDELVAELARIHDVRHGEAIRVAVVYGAAHLPTVIQTLHEKYGYRAVRGGEWLTVIDL